MADQPDETVTPVVFRVWNGTRGGVFALLPADDEGNGLCSSFEHVGQHGGADYSGCIARSRPAAPAEYADLQRELEAEPYRYRLKVLRRWSRRR